MGQGAVVTEPADLPAVPEEVLRAWPGRFQSSDLVRRLHGSASDGIRDVADALLAGLAASQDEEAALARLIGDGEFILAERMLAECSVLTGKVVRSATGEIESRRSAAVSRLSDELRRLEELAAAAQISFDPPAADLEELAQESWGAVARLLAEHEEHLTAEIEQRAAKLDECLGAADVADDTRRMAESLLKSRRLRAARHVLENGTLDLPGPEIQPPMVTWRWKEPPQEVLRWHIDPNIPKPPGFEDWVPADESAERLINALDGLNAGGDGSAREFAEALDGFLGPASEPHVLHPIPDGFLTSVHNLFASGLLSRFRPTGNVPLFIGEPGVGVPPQLPGVGHFLAVAPQLESAAYRGPCAVASVRDLLRLVTVPSCRDISLARVAGRQWPLAGLGAGSPADLAQLLGDSEELRWHALCWLTDLTGLGGSATADALLFQSGGDPTVLHVLLDYLLRREAQQAQRMSSSGVHAWRDDEQTRALVEAAVLRDAQAPGDLAAFWSAVAAAPPGTSLSRDALVLAASLIEDGTDWDAPISAGYPGLATQWFAETAGPDVIALRRTGAMIGLRPVAERRIADLARDLRDAVGGQPEPAMTAWAAYRFALSPQWPVYRDVLASAPPDSGAVAEARAALVVPAERLIEEAAVLTGTADLTAVAAELKAAAAQRYGKITVEVEAPPEAVVAVHERVALAILYELLENAIEAVEVIGTVALTVQAFGVDIFVDVHDTGRGLAKEIDGGFRVFRRGFSTRGTGRGQGLFVVRQIAQTVGGDLELVSRADTHPVLRGAHFRLVLPRPD
jgi:Histidine kinase-, DNA gyrase B-, and HSP90-like ATPase